MNCEFSILNSKHMTRHQAALELSLNGLQTENAADVDDKDCRVGRPRHVRSTRVCQFDYVQKCAPGSRVSHLE